MGWIQTLLEQTELYEAPRHYYFWSGLAAISAAIKDQLWINRASEKFKTYPNIYVLLLAKTGITRKSHPVSLIEQVIVEARCTRVISGRGSIEKILDDLGTTTTLTDESNSNRRIIKDSSGFIISGELSASLINNSQALTILTNLYDRNYNVGKWTVNLKSGVKTLNKPTITFLAATNDQHMKSFFEAKDMYGGFLGRTFVVSADAPKRLNALLRHNDNTPDVKDLSNYLKEISKLNGEMKINDEVITMYENWYEGFYGPVQRGEADVDDKTGTFSRIGEHTLKVAMLLSLSDGPSLEISKDHMLEAISLCEPFVEISARAVRGIGKSSLAQQTAMIMEYLESKNGFATRINVLQRFQGDIDHNDLTNIQSTLEESGFIVIERYGTGVAYQVPKVILEKYKAWRSAKKGGS